MREEKEEKALDSAPLFPPEAQAGAGARQGRFWLRLFAWGGGLSLFLLLAFALGFALFVGKTLAVKQPEAAMKADAVIVLTGGRARIETGLQLLAAGRGARLLISGVSPIIRGRHNFAHILGVNKQLLECCVDLGWEALNTSGNAAETAIWAEKYGYRRLLIVTNRYHMLRSLAELRHKMPQAELIPYPVEQTGSLFQPAGNFRLFATEYGKFLVVGLRNFAANLGIGG